MAAVATRNRGPFDAVDVEDMAADAEAETSEAQGDLALLGSVSKLAVRQLELERRVEAAAEALRVASEELAKVQCVSLPDALRKVKMQKFTLDDGSVVELQEGWQAHISEENRDAAFAWFKKMKRDGLIKTELTAYFGRESAALLKAAVSALRKLKVQVGTKRSIHGGTLKKFVTEMKEAGKPVPDDLLGVFPYSKAVIKTPKAKAAK